MARTSAVRRHRTSTAAAAPGTPAARRPRGRPRRARGVGFAPVSLDGEALGRPPSPDEYSRGSRGYARRLPPPGEPARPVAGFLFDMVGDKDLEIYDEANSASRATNLVDLVHEAAQ